MALSATERRRRFRAKTIEEGIIPSQVDEVTGEPIVVQPDKGVGCKMEPDKYRQVVLDMKNGVSMYEVAAKHEVSRSSVELIRKRHADIIPTRQKQAIDKLHEVHEATSDLLLKLAKEKKLPPGVVPVAFGICFDKLSAALGTNIQKHEHIHAVLPQDDVKTALSGLKAGNEPTVHAQKSQKTEEKVVDAQILHKNEDDSEPTRGAGGVDGPEGGEAGMD